MERRTGAAPLIPNVTCADCDCLSPDGTCREIMDGAHYRNWAAASYQPSSWRRLAVGSLGRKMTRAAALWDSPCGVPSPTHAIVDADWFVGWDACLATAGDDRIEEPLDLGIERLSPVTTPGKRDPSRHFLGRADVLDEGIANPRVPAFGPDGRRCDVHCRVGLDVDSKIEPFLAIPHV